MNDGYKGRLSVFVKEMQEDPVILSNDRLADETVDQEYRFRRNKAFVLDKSLRSSVDHQRSSRNGLGLNMTSFDNIRNSL